jgi:hypothetical protein
MLTADRKAALPRCKNMPTVNSSTSEIHPEIEERGSSLQTEIFGLPQVSASCGYTTLPSVAVIPDYFLPAYVEKALKQAGLFHVHQVPSEPGSSLTIEHLDVTAPMLRLIGDQLRQRQAALIGHKQYSERMAGLKLLANDLCRPDSAFRQEALSVVCQLSGFSPEMIALLLNSFGEMFGMVQPDIGPVEFSYPQSGPGFTKSPFGYAHFYSDWPDAIQKYLGSGKKNSGGTPPAKLEGLPRLVTSIAAGNVPGISVLQAFFPLLIGAACLTKNSSSEPYFGGRFLTELAALEETNQLFPCSDLVVLLTFPGRDRTLLEEIIHQGDHVVATGGHDSKREILGMVNRLRIRGQRDLLRRTSGHWHKVSFDVVTQEYLTPAWIEKVAYNVAFDNSMFNTQGCLSCQQVFVEGSETQVLEFSKKFVEQMKIILARLPKGCDAEAGLREMYHQCEKTPGVKILTGLRDMLADPFFVAYEGQPAQFAVFNALNRSIMIRRVENLEVDLPRLLKGVPDDLLQSCGAAIPETRLFKLADILGRAGVNRIVPVGDIWNMVPGLESWDGYLPPADMIHAQHGYWTTIKFHDPSRAIEETYSRNRALLKD